MPKWIFFLSELVKILINKSMMNGPYVMEHVLLRDK